MTNVPVAEEEVNTKNFDFVEIAQNSGIINLADTEEDENTTDYADGDACQNRAGKGGQICKQNKIFEHNKISNERLPQIEQESCCSTQQDLQSLMKSTNEKFKNFMQDADKDRKMMIQFLQCLVQGNRNTTKAPIKKITELRTLTETSHSIGLQYRSRSKLTSPHVAGTSSTTSPSCATEPLCLSIPSQQNFQNNVSDVSTTPVAVKIKELNTTNTHATKNTSSSACTKNTSSSACTKDTSSSACTKDTSRSTESASFVGISKGNKNVLMNLVGEATESGNNSSKSKQFWSNYIVNSKTNKIKNFKISSNHNIQNKKAQTPKASFPSSDVLKQHEIASGNFEGKRELRVVLTPLPANKHNISSTGRVVPPKCNKPVRSPCCFCNGKLKVRLRCHQEKMHNEEEVEVAMSLPPSGRTRAFNVLKRKGIEIWNREKIKEGDKSKLLRERYQTKTKDDLVKKNCGICKRFFSKKYFGVHYRNCKRKSSQLQVNKAPEVPVKDGDLLLTGYEGDPGFHTEILGKFLFDKIGSECRNNPTIKYIGYFFYNEKKGSPQKVQVFKESIIKEMRFLALLFLNFKHVVKDQSKVFDDMFNKNYLHAFKEAVLKTVAMNVNKNHLGYCIDRVILCLNKKYAQEMKTDKKRELKEFKQVLKQNLNWNPLFGNQNFGFFSFKQLSLKRPVNLSKEVGLGMLRDYLYVTLNQLVGNNYKDFDHNNYFLLRRVTLSCITILNARRGVKPCQLTLKQYEQAINDEWLNINFVQDALKRNEIDPNVLKEFKLVFQKDKGIKTLAVLIPLSCLTALQILVDPGTRTAAHICPKNWYLFPEIGQTVYHASGVSDLNWTMHAAGIFSTVIAKNIKQYIYADQDHIHLPDDIKQLFYIHKDHSKDMKEPECQRLNVFEETTEVSWILNVIDQNHDELDKYTSLTDYESEQNLTLKTGSRRKSTRIKNSKNLPIDLLDELDDAEERNVKRRK